MPGIADRFISQNLKDEADRRIGSITKEMVPKLESMIVNQEETNKLLKDILDELRKLNR